MTLSIKVNDEIFQKLKVYYQNEEITPPLHAKFAAKTANCHIIVYETNKVVFSGKKAQSEANKWQDSGFEEIIGSDEVGKGDFFGPLIVCACYITKSQYKELQMYKIQDSKKFSDDKIISLAPKLMALVNYQIKYYTNAEINTKHANNMNMNEILAHLHYEAVITLQQKYQKQVIIDGFTTTNKFFEYLQKVNHDLLLIPKAEEKYFTVAVASIIARYHLILYFKKMEQHIQEKFNLQLAIPFGASKQVDIFAKHLFTKIDLKYANFYTKTFFKNFQKIEGEKND